MDKLGLKVIGFCVCVFLLGSVILIVYYATSNSDEEDSTLFTKGVYESKCSGVVPNPPTLVTDVKKTLKLAHFKNANCDMVNLCTGYDAAHVYPQSKIAANVNYYLKHNEVKNLRALMNNLFEFDPEAYVFDLDQRETGVHNPDNFFGNPKKYSPDYITRNGANVADKNKSMKQEVQTMITNYENAGSLTEADYGKLLLRMCWAPANLRYGRKISNGQIVGDTLDPMGNQEGEITTQEKWFRDANLANLGNLVWKPPTTCPSAKNLPCRPTSTGKYQILGVGNGNPWPGSPFVVCDSTNC